MDKILSARVDEAVIRMIGLLARRLRTTKKAVIERAILALAEKVETESKIDLREQTHGVWERDEPARDTVARARDAFRKSMERHHR